ncbi:hypothetical protein MKJ04_12545 [Pontibacter sp. E15-1]|uniref:hypothetical protein n=1 Tax=Pontibacter sp. E15-1 TaxID=2919918 RepID=UPI001F50130E|nr:hypothetical protein [Pontibacter sp. E15-1]MCJ8165673.1 hypothetical protein [Pontibacter sp. E15-1]
MALEISARQIFAFAFIAIYVGIAISGLEQAIVLWLLALVIPLHLIYWQDIRQGRHTLLRNYPLVGYLRYFFESIRPAIRQYFDLAGWHRLFRLSQ